MELTSLQKGLLERYKNHSFNQFTATAEEQVAFMDIIDDAEKLERELGACEESEDDLILWYCNKVGI